MKQQLKNLLFRNNNHFSASKKTSAIFGKGLFIFICVSHLNAQVNLIQNPGFEQISSCPLNGGQLFRAFNWDTLAGGGGGSPDLFSPCGAFVVQVPENAFTFQHSLEGNNYAGFGAYIITTGIAREYIQNELASTLTGGKSYCLSFYLNLANSSKYAIDEVGAFLDNGSVGTTPNNYITLTPQVSSVSGTFLTDTANWVQVRSSFTATGTETFLTIGNFKSDAATNKILFNSSASQPFAYYAIDKLSLIPTDISAFAGNDTNIVQGDSVFIGRANEIGLNDDCFWYIAGSSIPFDTVAGLWVNPITNTTYVVEQNICGTVSFDTVNIYVSGVGINENGITNHLTSIFPNPATNVISIQPYTKTTENIFVQIKTLNGKSVFEKNLRITNGSANFNISDLDNGVYFVHILDISTGETAIKKLVIQK